MVKIFEQGDIIYLDFDPQAGHEQKGRRPAIVISNNTYNRFSKMLMVCPITNTNKKHPFHIELDSNLKTTGVILCDQSKMLDVGIRNATFVEKAPDHIIADVVDMVYSFIEI
jgi:mRNA interferase MazF